MLALYRHMGARTQTQAHALASLKSTRLVNSRTFARPGHVTPTLTRYYSDLKKDSGKEIGKEVADSLSSGSEAPVSSSLDSLKAKADQPNNLKSASSSSESPSHGFDPNKPRKPLSRIAIGSKIDIERERQMKTIGFLNWKAAVVFILVGAGMTWYFRKEKERLTIQREAEANRGYGKPLVGGPFKLVDHNGNIFTDKDLLGKFSLLYFGFSMCPDICPEELDKMTEILNVLNKDADNKQILPVFVTCDPNRDSPEVLKEYLADFHPDIIGLTGSYEDIKQTCKAYRVYFSTPPNLKTGDDYLVDHSIFFYLMDPEGNFIDALGNNYDSETALARIKEHMDAWMPEDKREQQKKGFFGKLFDGDQSKN